MSHALRSIPLVLVAVLSVVLVGCASGGGTSTAASAAEDVPSHTSESAAASSSESPADEGPPADATRLEDGDTIVMSQFAFSQSAVVVPLGATLTFANEDNVFHTVTNGVQGFAAENAAFDQPVEAGSSIEVTFDEPGRYDITCEPHPIMQMTVFVEG